jgi:tape measure domain-containing protein
MARIDIGLIITAINGAGPQLTGATQQVNQLGNAARNTSQRLRAIQVVMAGIATGAAYQFAKGIVQAAASLQSTQLRLAAVTGSMSKANEVFSALNAKFGPAGLDVGILTDGFVRLAASGLSLDKTRETIDALANATAAFGGDSQQLQRAVIGISQVVGKGTLQMEELRQQIGEAVPVAIKLMATEAGVSVAKFTQMVSKGMIDSETAVRLFTEGSKKAFGDFAANLGATLTGSIGRISSEFTAGLGNLLANTNFGDRLVELFNTAADAVKEFLNSIDQSQVDAFFATIGALAETTFAFVEAMTPAISAIYSVGVAIGDLLSLLPPEVVGGLGLFGLAMFGGVLGAAGVFGLIGQGIQLLNSFGGFASEIATSITAALPIGLIALAFLSPVGAGILTIVIAALDRIATYFKDTIVSIIGFFDSASAEAFDRAVKRSNSVLGAIKDIASASVQAKQQTTGLASSIFSFAGKTGQAALDLIKAMQNKAATQIKIPAGIPGTITPNQKSAQAAANAAERLAEKIERIKKDLADTMETVNNDLEKMAQTLSGDKLGASLADVNKKFDGTNQKITDAILKATQLDKKTHDQGDTIKQLNDMLGRSNSLRDQAILREKTLYDLKVQQQRVEEQINNIQIAAQIRDLNRKRDTSAGGNLMSGTEGGQLVLEVERQREELNKQYLESLSKVAEIKEKLLTEVDPQTIATLQEQIKLQEQLGSTSLQAANELSASAIASQQLWSDVGKSISDGIGNALTGLINGTKSLKDVMNDVWNSITNAVVKYIQKLIEAQIQESLLDGAGGGGGGGGGLFSIIGGLFGFANGGAFQGQVTPFANGGVVQGPTMFGLMGEQGSEAIMPLTRIGGKLGVRSSGGSGGNHYTINVSAIDTQTGMQFIGKHIDTIQNGMQARSRINRGIREKV